MINFDSQDFVDSIITQTFEVDFRGRGYIFSAITKIMSDSNNKRIPLPFNLYIDQIGECKIENGIYNWSNYNVHPPIFNEYDIPPTGCY